MKLTKELTEFGTDVFYGNDSTYLIFAFGGNLDLYLGIHTDSDISVKEFTITKENYALYSLFVKLFSDIQEINLYDEDDIPLFLVDEEERRAYILERRKEHERLKELCHLYNHADYNDLFCREARTITWYSDETAKEVANYLIIRELNDTYKLEFHTQSYLFGYGFDFATFHYVPIRFCNSGSRYDPFNTFFMRFYNQLLLIDDVNDYGHQIHIEEYFYQENKVKRLNKPNN